MASQTLPGIPVDSFTKEELSIILESLKAQCAILSRKVKSVSGDNELVGVYSTRLAATDKVVSHVFGVLHA